MFGHLFRNAMTAAIAATGTALTAGFFCILDANPSLYVHDKVWVSTRSKQQYWNGKHVWITGASSGIGAELAQQLSSCGAHVILSSRSPEKLQEVAQTCRANNNNKVWVLPLDVTCPPEELDTAVDQVLEYCGGNLDCVVLNAGRGHLTPAIQTSRQTSREMMELNTLGPMAMTQTLLQKCSLKKIVVMSSVAGKFAVPLSASYTASKHALQGYFHSLQCENPSLQVHLICPGPIATPFHDNKESQPQESKRKLQMPVKRCVDLVMSDISSRKRNGEVWVAQQPTLAFCFLSQYMPSVARLLLNRIGPIRIAVWEQGLDLYDPQSFRKVKMDKPKHSNNTKQD